MGFEEQKFKTTLPDRNATDMGKSHEKEMTKSLVRNQLPPTHLSEVDVSLNEKEESLKKKIWDLSKMEGLVHSDSKLSAIYNNMAEDGEDKYGYHYNETIMNIIFNDYVLNNPTYLQKYYMSVPTEKKRRDKSGIQQLQKRGKAQQSDIEKTRSELKKQRGINQEGEIHNNSLPGTIEELEDNSYHEGGREGTFDDREYLTHRINKKYDTMDNVREHHIENKEDKIDFILQHTYDDSKDAARYDKDSLDAMSDEVVKDLYRSVEKEMGIDETTGAASSGAYVAPLAVTKKGFAEGEEEKEIIDDKDEKKEDEQDDIDETTTSASSGQYTTKLGYKAGKRDPKLDKPAWHGGEIIGENYLTDGNAFKSFLNEMEEGMTSPNDDSRVPMAEDDYPIENGGTYTTSVHLKKTPTEMLQKSLASLMDGIVKLGKNAPKSSVDFASDIQKELVSRGVLKPQEPKQNIFQRAGKFLRGEGEEHIDEKSKSKNQQQFMGMVRATQKGEMDDPSPAVAKAAKEMSPEDVEDFASTKHKGLPEKVNTDEGTGETIGKIGGAIAGGALGKTPTAAMTGSKIGGAIGGQFDESEINENGTGVVQYHSERSGEEPFELYGQKWQYVNAIYPDGKKDIGVYRFGHDMVYDYDWFQKNVLSQQRQDETMANTKESDPTTMAATMKDVPAGGTPMGFGESENIDEKQKDVKIEDNNPLKDFGISKSGVGGHNINATSNNHNGEPIQPKKMEDMSEDVSTRTKCKSDEIPNIDGTPINEPGGCIKKHSAEKSKIKDIKGKELSDKELNPSNYKARLKRMGKYQKELDAKKGEYSKELEKSKDSMDKLKGKKQVSEDKKHPSMVNVDRLGKDNEENFKRDLGDSNTEMLKTQKDEIMAKDQIEVVPDNPYELAEKIEKEHLANTEGKSFKNVGDSTNDAGDEIPKRNNTSEEDELLNLYRNGQHSWDYDAKPSERFEERMKKDMGEEIYELRKKQMEFQAGAPMYNKDTQPTEDAAVNKVQYDKNKAGYNQKKGFKMEGVVTAKYKDDFGKNNVINFNLNEAEEVADVSDLIKLNLDGMGNSYTTRVEENHEMRNMMDAFDFYINGEGNVKYAKTGKQTLTESENKEKEVINEQFEQMKKLMGYDPSKHVDTSSVKKNRGF